MIRIAALLLLGAATCCANVVLQFVPEGVECCWVGDVAASPTDPVPLPQPRQRFINRAHIPHYSLTKPIIVDTIIL